MKTQIKILAVTALLSVISCSTSNIKISNDLKSNADVFAVSGNSGILINKKIKFGTYETSPVKRGITTSSKLTLLGLSHEKAEQTIRFFQNSPEGKSAEIFAMNIYNDDEFKILKGLDKYFTSFQNGFLAMISPSDSEKVWKLYIHNDNSLGASKTDVDFGYAIDEEGNEIKINGTKYLEKDSFFTNDTKTFGFEFLQNGKAIGAVSVINNGNVWIDRNLNPDMKLLVASLASALMVKRNLATEIKQ